MYALIHLLHFHPVLVTVQKASLALLRLFEQMIYFKLAHLERLKLASPEREASSMSGVMIFSAMSDSTVNVGSTMKSIKPEGWRKTNTWPWFQLLLYHTGKQSGHTTHTHQSETGPPWWTCGHKEERKQGPVLPLYPPGIYTNHFVTLKWCSEIMIMIHFIFSTNGKIWYKQNRV